MSTQNTAAENTTAENPAPGTDSHTCSAAADARPARYEIVPQRGGARIRVRYREGSASNDCRLCR